MVNSRKKAKILPRNRFFSGLWQVSVFTNYLAFVCGNFGCGEVNIGSRFKAISQSVFGLLHEGAAPLVVFLCKLEKLA